MLPKHPHHAHLQHDRLCQRANRAASDTPTPSQPPFALGLEIRSVNSRFFDLTFKMPEELRQHEAAMRELLMQHLKRGKVEVRAHIRKHG